MRQYIEVEVDLSVCLTNETLFIVIQEGFFIHPYWLVSIQLSWTCNAAAW